MDQSVHTGLWMDWSKGHLSGLTLTVPVQSGNVILSFVTILVSVCGLQMWGILCFTIHQLRVDHQARDALYHQHQVLLRNSGNEASTLVQLLRMVAAWRKHTKSALRRSLPLIIIATLHIAAFTCAGLFSSRFIHYTDKVLLLSKQCGWVEEPSKLLGAFLRWQPDERQLEVTKAVATSARWSFQRSQAYAAACYPNQPGALSSMCNTLPKQRIESKVERVKQCPFPDVEMCKTHLLVLDSGYINSDLDLGLSAPEDERISVRRVVSAVPIRAERHMTPIPPPLTDSGAAPVDLTGQNITYEVYFLGKMVDLDQLWTAAVANATGGVPPKPYSLIAYTAFVDLEKDEETEIIPIPQIRVEKADLTLAGMTNIVRYTEEVSDPWFKADNMQTDPFPTWGATQQLSFIAILEQYQFCAQLRCSPLTGINALQVDKNHSLSLNPAQKETYSILWRTMWNSRSHFAGFFLGEDIFLAKNLLWGGIVTSQGLPNDQWEKEVMGINNVSLAMIQRRMIEHVYPPQLEVRPNVYTTSFIIPPNSEEGRKLCTRQRARNAAYSSFNFLGLLAITFVALAIIATNLILSMVVAWLQKRFGRGQARREAWVENSVLHLQRLAFEGRTDGAWQGHEKDIPVTAIYGQKLQMPSTANLPRENREATYDHELNLLQRGSDHTSQQQFSNYNRDYNGSQTCLPPGHAAPQYITEYAGGVDPK